MWEPILSYQGQPFLLLFVLLLGFLLLLFDELQYYQTIIGYLISQGKIFDAILPT